MIFLLMIRLKNVFPNLKSVLFKRCLNRNLWFGHLKRLLSTKMTLMDHYSSRKKSFKMKTFWHFYQISIFSNFSRFSGFWIFSWFFQVLVNLEWVPPKRCSISELISSCQRYHSPNLAGIYLLTTLKPRKCTWGGSGGMWRRTEQKFRLFWLN